MPLFRSLGESTRRKAPELRGFFLETGHCPNSGTAWLGVDPVQLFRTRIFKLALIRLQLGDETCEDLKKLVSIALKRVSTLKWMPLSRVSVSSRGVVRDQRCGNLCHVDCPKV